MTTPRITKNQIELERIAAASVTTPTVAGQVALFFNTSNSDHLSSKDSGATVIDLQAAASTSFADNVFFVTDNSDATKKIAFEASGITTATTRTLTAPNFDGTIATLAGTETLTNKSISASQINSGVLDPLRMGAVARTSMGTGASYTVTGFPATGYALLITTLTRCATVATVDVGRLRLGDGGGLDSTAANYYTYRMIHSGTTPTQTAAENFASTAYFNFQMAGASAPSSYVSVSKIWIFDYASSSRYKFIQIENSYYTSSSTGGGAVEVISGIWQNTSKACTQIEISAATGNLADPSAFSYQILGSA